MAFGSNFNLLLVTSEAGLGQDRTNSIRLRQFYYWIGRLKTRVMANVHHAL